MSYIFDPSLKQVMSECLLIKGISPSHLLEVSMALVDAMPGLFIVLGSRCCLSTLQPTLLGKFISSLFSAGSMFTFSYPEFTGLQNIIVFLPLNLSRPIAVFKTQFRTQVSKLS